MSIIKGTPRFSVQVSEPAGDRQPKVGHKLLLRRLRLAPQPLDGGGELGLLADRRAALRDELGLGGASERERVRVRVRA